MTERPELWVVRPGTVPYGEALDWQKRLEAARGADEIPDVLLLLEHHPVYTKGRRTEARHLPMGEDWYRMQGIEVCDTNRGGQVTYHGPGQLVAYPILRLPDDDVVAYVRGLERVMIESLGAYGIEAQVFDGLTGVWTAGDPPIEPGQVGPQRTPVGAATLPGRPAASTTAEPRAARSGARKIGSIGIHVNAGITTHGLAINVNNDLQPFEWVVPCAIEGIAMTSLCRELGSEQDLDAFATHVRDRFARVFARQAVEVEREVLQPVGT